MTMYYVCMYTLSFVIHFHKGFILSEYPNLARYLLSSKTCTSLTLTYVCTFDKLTKYMWYQYHMYLVNLSDWPIEQIFWIGTVRYTEGLWRMHRHGPVTMHCTDSEDYPPTALCQYPIICWRRKSCRIMTQIFDIITSLTDSSRKRKFLEAKRLGSERARERIGQGEKRLGSESSRKMAREQKYQGAKRSGSEKVPGKSSESVQCAMLKACDACADMDQL